jgi:Isocitrate/isopropylmalate dehydrogenase
MAYNITLIPGDGIGPEVMTAAKSVLDASGVEINWETVEAGEKVIAEFGTPLPDYVIESIKKNKIAIKGPVTTPVGKGFKSVNVGLRQALDLYANVRPVKTYPGIKSRYEDVDLIIVRENTEDLYAGIEHSIGDVAAESIKLITKKASDRIVEYAFDLAEKAR